MKLFWARLKTVFWTFVIFWVLGMILYYLAYEMWAKLAKILIGLLIGGIIGTLDVFGALLWQWKRVFKYKEID